MRWLLCNVIQIQVPIANGVNAISIEIIDNEVDVYIHISVYDVFEFVKSFSFFFLYHIIIIIKYSIIFVKALVAAGE